MAALKVAFADYGPASLLRNREIAPHGFDLEFVDTGTPVQGMARMVRDLEFDFIDMSPTTFLAARSRGVPLVALPIALYAEFPHMLLWCRKAAGIRAPRDLIGKTIGVRTWLSPATVWMRGLLKTEYSVDLDSATWMTTVEDPIPGVVLPVNVRRSTTEPRAFKLLEMLHSGEIDVAIDALTLQWHHALALGKVDPGTVEPVFGDALEVTNASYRRSQFVPVMHLVVTKQSTLDEKPEAARAIYDAFREAKGSYIAGLKEHGVTRRAREAWLIARDEDNVELLERGIEPLAIGAEAERSVATLRNYMVEFSYLPAQPPTSSEFVTLP